MPQPSLRRRRGRYVWISVALVVLAVTTLANFSDSSLDAAHRSLDPGPLSRVHHEFSGEQGCKTCHQGHSGDIGHLAQALFQPAAMGEACTQCHSFGGRETLPHNQVFPQRTDLAPTDCGSCHTEHKGDTLIKGMSNQQCGTACHAEGFTNFARGHPAFPPAFPNETPGSIRFDHEKHFRRYFPQHFRGAPVATLSEARQCLSCHAVEQSSREVKPRNYERACANCHDEELRRQQLVLARGGEPAPMTALLLGMAVDDLDTYDGQRVEFLQALAKNGADPLVELLEEDRFASPEASYLAEQFEGFAIDTLASAWLGGEEIDLSSPAGLSADGDALYYRVHGHADPVAKAWLDLAARQVIASKDGPSRRTALQTLAAMASDDGGTACGKCHAVGQVNELGQLPWQYRGPTRRPLSRYAHAPHINLLGPARSCGNCHLIDSEADYGEFFDALAVADPTLETPYQSNFHPITLDTCSTCHNDTGVGDSCSLCHNYHQDAAFAGQALNKIRREPATPKSPPADAGPDKESP